MKSWQKLKLGQVGIGLNIAQNHSSSLQKVIIYSKLEVIRIKLSQKCCPLLSKDNK